MEYWLIEKFSVVCSWENIEPVEEYNREGLNEVGTTMERWVYSKSRKQDFTEYRRHQSCNCLTNSSTWKLWRDLYILGWDQRQKTVKNIKRGSWWLWVRLQDPEENGYRAKATNRRNGEEEGALGSVEGGIYTHKTLTRRPREIKLFLISAIMHTKIIVTVFFIGYILGSGNKVQWKPSPAAYSIPAIFLIYDFQQRRNR